MTNGHKKSEVAVKKEVRRRLTRKVQVAAGTETSSSEKKESECEYVEDDSVKVKKEKIAEQIHSIDKRRSVAAGKEGDRRGHGARHEILQFWWWNTLEGGRSERWDGKRRTRSWQIATIKSEGAVKKEVRRRLTRKVQVAAGTETSSSEKSGDGRAKIKMETVAQHEVSFASPLADADGHEDGCHTRTLQHPQKGRPEPQKGTESLICFKMIENGWTTRTICYEGK